MTLGQVVTLLLAGCPQWLWGALTGGDGCSSTVFSLLEAWGLPHPLCHTLGVVLSMWWAWSSQPGSWGLCLGALEHQEPGRCHLGWERLFWAAREWPQTQDWGSSPELSYIILSYLIS